MQDLTQAAKVVSRCLVRESKTHIVTYGRCMQVPQYLLEAATERGGGGQCNIICTQPRRIAAISVAERVANERGDSAPGTPGQHPVIGHPLDARLRFTMLLRCHT